MTIELGILLSVFGVVIAFQGYYLNKQKHQKEQSKEEKEDTKESTEIRLQLGYISKGVDDIRLDIKNNERQMAAIGERVTRVEESAKAAHKRIDDFSKGEV